MKLHTTLLDRFWPDQALRFAAGIPEGKSIWKRLVYASDTKIKHHVKIRRDANPFDPQWRPYFAARAFHKKFGISRQQAGLQPS